MTQTDNNKTLNVTGGTWTGWNIYGGSESTNIDGYILNLSGVTGVLGIEGGHFLGSAPASNSSVTGNTVNMTDSSAIGDVYGGYASNDGAMTPASENTVKMVNSSANNVYGGWTQNSVAESNIVTLAESNVAGSVYGGYTKRMAGNANSNVVTLSDSNVAGAFTADGQIIIMATPVPTRLQWLGVQ